MWNKPEFHLGKKQTENCQRNHILFNLTIVFKYCSVIRSYGLFPYNREAGVQTTGCAESNIIYVYITNQFAPIMYSICSATQPKHRWGCESISNYQRVVIVDSWKWRMNYQRVHLTIFDNWFLLNNAKKITKTANALVGYIARLSLKRLGRRSLDIYECRTEAPKTTAPRTEAPWIKTPKTKPPKDKSPKDKSPKRQNPQRQQPQRRNFLF